MPDAQIVIRLDRKLLAQFRGHCVMRESNTSREIQRLVKEQLKAWQVEMQQPQALVREGAARE